MCPGKFSVDAGTRLVGVEDFGLPQSTGYSGSGRSKPPQGEFPLPSEHARRGYVGPESDIQDFGCAPRGQMLLAGEPGGEGLEARAVLRRGVYPSGELGSGDGAALAAVQKGPVLGDKQVRWWQFMGLPGGVFRFEGALQAQSTGLAARRSELDNLVGFAYFEQVGARGTLLLARRAGAALPPRRGSSRPVRPRRLWRIAHVGGSGRRQFGG